MSFDSLSNNYLSLVLQVGFKTFLNITPSISHHSAPPPGSSTASTPQRTSNPPAPSTGPGSSFVLTFEENPLAEFVELPEEALEGGLWYSNILCGVLRGALEMVSSLPVCASCPRAHACRTWRVRGIEPSNLDQSCLNYAQI